MKPIVTVTAPVVLVAAGLLSGAVPPVLGGEPATPAVIDHTVTTLEGDTSRPGVLPRQADADRQHRVEVRIHAAVRGLAAPA